MSEVSREAATTFTGIRRRRRTRRSVWIADALARITITTGGIGTILAVLLVCLFLVWEVLPLFLSARIGEHETIEPALGDAPPLRSIGTDEHRMLGWSLAEDGTFRVIRLDTGALKQEFTPFTGRTVTSIYEPREGRRIAVGFADGGFAFASLAFSTSFFNSDEVSRELRDSLAALPPRSFVDFEDGVVQLTTQGQYRVKRAVLTVEEGRKLGDGKVVAISWGEKAGDLLVAAALESEGATSLKLTRGALEEDFLSGEQVLAFGRVRDLPLAPEAIPPASPSPAHVLVSSGGSNVYAIWPEGSYQRFRTTRLKDSFLAETGRLLDGDGTALSLLSFVLGDTTLLYADDQGNVRAAFPVRIAERSDLPLLGNSYDPDRIEFGLAETKVLVSGASPAISFAGSSRSRSVAIGFADGTVRAFYVTSASEIGRLTLPPGVVPELLAFCPKEDGLLIGSGGKLHSYSYDPRHPDASLNSLFAPVWYEGYPEPKHTWQSSSGHASFEPKLGLVPLIVGTLKATFYSMLFGAPLALLAAIYTSEFMGSRSRAIVKPTIELMASLPSVVLGFLAALVFAPFVERNLASVLLLFYMVPVSFLFGAYAWQLLPPHVAIRYSWLRMPTTIPVMILGILASALLGPTLESWLFAGDIHGWLANSEDAAGQTAARFESAFGGWMLFFFPLAALVAALVGNRMLIPLIRLRANSMSRIQVAILDFGRFAITAGAAILLACVLSAIFDGMGFDPRGGLVDTYVQRNALVVGFVMGFAIIPIIYTIADDALTSVPNHLRSASLGAGATHWQTAMRIIIPTAMSGLFSALMIGLGRAVGETMIVLMAAGNTPVMDMNIFEGFRTLSANIAVEMPEAVKGSTHYRTLFLAALVLFAMTFVVNTLAEIVRQRFRKRAYQL